MSNIYLPYSDDGLNKAHQREEGKPSSLTVREVVQQAFSTAMAKGFHAEDEKPLSALRLIAWMGLVCSEAAEAMEDVRSGRMTTINRADGKPEGFGSELADIVIRVCDTAGACGIDLEAEIRAKMAYNDKRPRKHGGKAL